MRPLPFKPLRPNWSQVPAWAVLTRRKVVGRPELPLLSVYRDHGVVLKESREDNFNQPGEDLAAYQAVRPGDVVANKMKTWQGSIAVSEHGGLVSPAYIVCAIAPGLHPRFLHYLLRSRPYVAEYRRLSYGVRPAQWDLRWEDFRTIALAIPNQSTQFAIADFLDRETARIDDLAAKKQRLIELLEEKRTAVITQAVTKGLEPTVPMKESGVLWIGEVPVHWVSGRLQHLVESEQAGAWGEGVEDADEGIICVRVADFDRTRRVVSLSHPTYRAVPPAQRLPRLLRPGDVLLEKSGGGDRQPVGFAVLFSHDVEAITSNFVSRLRPRPGVDGRYLNYVLAAAYSMRLNVRSINQTTGIQNLDSRAYLSESWCLAPKAEQVLIADRLDAQTAQMISVSNLVAAQLDLLAEYRQALITAAVTGQIDVSKGAPDPEEAVA